MTPRLVALSLIVVALTCVASAAQDTKKDDAKKDQEAMQGTWKVSKYLAGGKEQASDLAKKITVLIVGDKLTLKLENDIVGEGTFKLDPGKTPKEMDMTTVSGSDKGQVRKGIYEIDEDTLKICFNVTEAAKTQRPASFDAAKAGTAIDLMILQRVKK
jgi:uncharacterized protein (TIGR03067 family)